MDGCHIYLNGLGLKKDPQKAYHYFMKGANNGHAQSQHYVGMMNYYGIGIPANLDDSIYWLEKAAKKNFELSVNFLAKLRSQ